MDSQEFPNLSNDGCTLENHDGPFLTVGKTKESQTQPTSTTCDHVPLTPKECHLVGAIQTWNPLKIVKTALFISGGKNIYTEHRTLIRKKREYDIAHTCQRRWHILIPSSKLVKAIWHTENWKSDRYTYKYLLDVSFTVSGKKNRSSMEVQVTPVGKDPDGCLRYNVGSISGHNKVRDTISTITYHGFHLIGGRLRIHKSRFELGPEALEGSIAFHRSNNLDNLDNLDLDSPVTFLWKLEDFANETIDVELRRLESKFERLQISQANYQNQHTSSAFPRDAPTSKQPFFPGPTRRSKGGRLWTGVRLN